MRAAVSLWFVNHGCQMGSFCEYRFFASVNFWHFLEGTEARRKERRSDEGGDRVRIPARRDLRGASIGFVLFGAFWRKVISGHCLHVFQSASFGIRQKYTIAVQPNLDKQSGKAQTQGLSKCVVACLGDDLLSSELC